MYICIESRSSWNDHVSAPLGVKEELQFWLDNLHYFNRYTILRSFTSTAILFSDASNTGYGSYLVTVGERHASGLWSENERFKSSTFRELKAIYNSLIIFSRFLQGRQLKICSENQNSVSFQWIPRSENEKADYLSRLVDPDDWSLNLQLFKILSNM